MIGCCSITPFPAIITRARFIRAFNQQAPAYSPYFKDDPYRMTATRESVTPAPHHLSESASRIGRNIAIVGLLSVASRVIGLLREIIIARQFGTVGVWFGLPDGVPHSRSSSFWS